MQPRINTIDHVHISVVDRLAAELWYQRVLGLTRAKELEFWAPGGGPLTIQNQEESVHLALFEGTPMKRPSTVAFGVTAEEFINWHAQLEEILGKKMEVEDHMVSWSLYFSDPDGNPFEITSYEYKDILSALTKSDA